MQRPSVVLPQPDSPTRPSVSPACTLEATRRRPPAPPDDAAEMTPRSAPGSAYVTATASSSVSVTTRRSGVDQRLAQLGLAAGSAEQRVAVVRPHLGLELRRRRSQASWACAQRGAKAQPGGRSSSDGGAARDRREPARLGRSSRGIEPISPQV